MAPTTALQTDYLVVGAGALGMGFVDTLLERSDADVIMVDRHHRAGGHWVDAYPFVQLHQPSRFYGVDSTPLGLDRIGSEGAERGFFERATGVEICDYYDRVMRDRFLETDRVRFFPMSDYLGNHRFRSRVTGAVTEVDVRRKVVDATYTASVVPATTPPPFDVDEGVYCVAPTALTTLEEAFAGYVVVGGGKTATDTICWLLDQGTDPGDVTWIRPRDAWYLNRVTFQPDEPRTLEAVVVELEAMHESATVEEAFERIEDAGLVLRTAPSISPPILRGATLNRTELEQLRRIDHVVRMGHVRRIGSERIDLDGGSVGTSTRHLHVHCAARGLSDHPPRPIFTDDTVTPQMITRVAACLSAGLVGVLESTERTTEEKNALCPPTGQPHTPFGWLRALCAGLGTEMQWLVAAPDLFEWVDGTRLNLLAGLPQEGEEVEALQGRLLASVGPALEKLRVFAAQATPAERALMWEPPPAVGALAG